MDHQIEHHGHVGAPRLEWGQPVDLQESRLVQIGGRRPDRAVEPLHVSHLEHGAARRCAAHQRFRPRDGVRERLLHEKRDTALQHGDPDLRVGGRRDRHRDRVHALQQGR